MKNLFFIDMDDLVTYVKSFSNKSGASKWQSLRKALVARAPEEPRIVLRPPAVTARDYVAQRHSQEDLPLTQQEIKARLD
ncbi:MAG: hypothetical protein ACXWVD_20305 [Telluria sp.]